MKTSRFILVLLAGAALLGAGCAKKKKEIADLDRRRAELLATEAQSATLMRNWTEAEEKLAQAVALCPDTGPYWITLGAVRKKLGKTAAAKTAYQSALSAFEEEAAENKTSSAPWLQQVYALALLGRADDARARLEKAAKQFPNDPAVVQWVGAKQLDAILADPKFKENAL